MEGPKEIVPTYFCAEKDVTRNSTAIIPDAEGRTDRPLPLSIEGDPGSVDFHKGYAGLRVDGENNPERSLRRLGGCVQNILGRVTLPDWVEMCAALHQEEIRRLSKVRSSSKGIRIKKEEEEDVALASEGKQEK